MLLLRRLLTVLCLPRLLAILSISAIFFMACAKSHPATPTPPFSVSASINGVPTTFNAIITVDSVSTPGTVYIVAHSDSANLTPLVEITLTSNTALKPGIYPYNQLTDSTGNIQGLIGYTNWSSDTDNQYFSLTDTVTLTTVNKTWLSGTFQGSCQAGYDSVATYNTITNGQFTVGWNQH
jgi:hypothetical protein